MIITSLLLTVERPLFRLLFTRFAGDAIRSDIRVRSVNVGSEVHIEPVIIRRPTRLPPTVAVLAHVDILLAFAAVGTI